MDFAKVKESIAKLFTKNNIFLLLIALVIAVIAVIFVVKNAYATLSSKKDEQYSDMYEFEGEPKIYDENEENEESTNHSVLSETCDVKPFDG